MKRLLITGCPRSGTGYMAELLSRCGLKSGHEQVFNPTVLDGLQQLTPDWPDDLQVESSWMAVPYIEWRNQPDLYVLHLVRHPLNVINSLLRIGFWSHLESRPYRMQAYAHLAFKSPSPLLQSMYFWLDWNLRAEMFADQTLPVERCEIPQLRSLLCAIDAPQRQSLKLLETALLDTPRDWNTKDRGMLDRQLTAPNLLEANYALCWSIRSTLSRYGYEL